MAACGLNKQYELYIESQNTNGDGVSHLDGYALFISGAVKGDMVLATVTKPEVSRSSREQERNTNGICRLANR